MSEIADLWRKAFSTWPTHFRRKGVLTPVDGEAIPFSDFVMTESILVLERPTPDNVGARRVAVPFERIDNLKYTEPLKTDQFLKAGFVKEMSADLAPEPVQQTTPPSPQQPVLEQVVAAAPQAEAKLQTAAVVSAVTPEQNAPQSAVPPRPTVPQANPPIDQSASQPPNPAAPQQPSLEQIQAAMLQRQQVQQQQMHQQG